MDVFLGMVLGVASVVPPGPVNIQTRRCGPASDLGAALALLAAIIGHVFWALLALAGVALPLTHATAQTILGITVIAPLMYLGWSGLRCWPGIVAPSNV